MGTPVEILDQASTYTRIYFAGHAALTLIYNIGSGVLRAVGDSPPSPVFPDRLLSVRTSWPDVLLVAGR